MSVGCPYSVCPHCEHRAVGGLQMHKLRCEGAMPSWGQDWPGDTEYHTQVVTVARSSLLVEARDLEIHVLDQVLQISLVLLRREGEGLAVGNVQVHSVLQRGGTPYPRHFQQSPEAGGNNL